MNKINNYIFNSVFTLWTVLILIIFTIPILINKKISLFVAKFWSKVVLLMLEYICKIRLDVRGLNNLPINSCFIIASKHQSALETIAFLSILDSPIYILKHELIKIPLYGRFLKKMDAIEIDRSSGIKALRKILKQFKELSHLDRPFVIFPEGTRVRIGEKLAYQTGIIPLYDLGIAPIIPTALNCGLVWDKSGNKNKGTAIIEFMSPIENNLSKTEFMQKLQNVIENKTDALIHEFQNDQK